MKSRQLVLILLLAATAAKAGPTLDHIRKAQVLACGVVTEENDETTDDTHGNLAAFSGEICRAVAAAVLGPQGKMLLHDFPSEQAAYRSLQDGKIDLFIGATPNADQGRHYGIAFLSPVFFDGQGLLVRSGAGIHGLADLDGKRVCFIDQTDAATVFTSAAARAGIKPAPFPFQEVGEMEAALVGGNCVAETFDVSKLAADRTLFHGRRNDYEILPDRLTLDPLAPVIRSDDPEWARIVDWVGYALIQAEISGVTRANLDSMAHSQDVAAQDLAGARPWAQWGLGLNTNWPHAVIQTTGNYGEIYDRTAGAHSPLRLPPGLNRPYTQGGLLWSPPWR